MSPSLAHVPPLCLLLFHLSATKKKMERKGDHRGTAAPFSAHMQSLQCGMHAVLSLPVSRTMPSHCTGAPSRATRSTTHPSSGPGKQTALVPLRRWRPCHPDLLHGAGLNIFTRPIHAIQAIARRGAAEAIAGASSLASHFVWRGQWKRIRRRGS